MSNIRFFECATPQERILMLVRAGESFDDIEPLIKVASKEIDLSKTLIVAIRLSLMNLDITIKTSEERSITGLAEQLLELHKKLYPKSYSTALLAAIHIMKPLDGDEVSENIERFDEIFFEGDDFERAVAQYHHFLSQKELKESKESKEENNHYYFNLLHLHYLALQSVEEIDKTYRDQFNIQVIQKTWDKLPDSLQKIIKRALPEKATWEDYRNIFVQFEESIFTIELLNTTNKTSCSLM